MKKITSWGKYPYVDATVLQPIKSEVCGLTTGSCIARGLGRSYGDSALAKEHAIKSSCAP